MDYEKEYNEMVQRCKELHESGNAPTKQQMEIVCPQLAESEDERIRKHLIKHFSQKTKDDWNGVPVEDILAWLEKQKENPKTANSIPSNCASDAKSKLPDDYPIGFPFDSEVMNLMCDAEQGDRNWRNKADVKFCSDKLLAIVNDGLEKQKEQKPNWVHHKVDLSDCSEEYMKAYYDGWNNCNQQHAQCDAEQRPAEWSEEDERMRDDIIDYMKPMPIFFEATVGESGKEYTQKFIEKAINWLKSLRPNHWKPSEEQIKALQRAIVQANTVDDIPLLVELRDSLKKL